MNPTMSADDLETQLRRLFAAQERSVRPSDRQWGDYVATAPAPPSRGRGTRVFVVLAAAVVLIVGVVAVVQRRSPTAAGTSTNVPVDWSTQYVAFTARELSIVVDGVTFVGADPAIERHSDPGGPNYQTLEVQWHEHGVEMRLYLYFASDGTDWWMTEMRTYDGRANADWVTFAGERMRTPLGQPYTDDLDLTATDHGVTSQVQISGLLLQAFRTVCTASPCAGAIAVANATANAETATTNH
jgi:hypothetical protein